MGVELIPIKAGQHSVVLVPRATTDLPFFYLTKQKTSLSQNIDYQGVDTFGRPMRWQVFPNTNPIIGAPGIDAHQAWMRLVKPSFDERLNQEGTVEIVPLGRVRECLRAVGWGQGGWEARRLLKALHQISAASCIADLWIPTTELDANGNPIFKRINATFSKLTIYAIGATHVTEEQLKSGNFNFAFDLEDTLYVQLHAVEAQIQKSQPQKYIDNQYLFSVKPAARRWYELMAGKIFGVVKNKGQYCEIRYSWYVKHHHTLKRHVQHKFVTKQMNEVAKDHLAIGYISKVEYRAIKEPDTEVDYIIRYYPGEGAKESIARIQGHIYRKRNQKQLTQEKSAANEVSRIDELQTEQGSETEQKPETITLSLLTMQDAENEQLVTQLVTKFGVVAQKAFELVKSKRESVALQLEIFPHRNLKPENPAGWIIKAIETNFSAPDNYRTAKEKQIAQELARAREEVLAACPFCQELKGFVHVEKDGYRAVRKCTHNPAIEAPNPT
jgi:hypothetical protein